MKHRDQLYIMKRNKTVPSAEMWLDRETVIQSEVRQKGNKVLYLMNTRMWNLEKNGTDDLICKAEIETQT